MLVYDSTIKSFVTLDEDMLIVGRDPKTKHVIGFVLDDTTNSGNVYFITSSVDQKWYSENSFYCLEDLMAEYDDLEFKVFTNE